MNVKDLLEISYMCGLDGYNSSEHLEFPSKLSYNDDDNNKIVSIEYNLTARTFDTSSNGSRYYNNQNNSKQCYL